MSLRYDIRMCDPAVVSKAEWPITHALILATVAVGMPWITDTNTRMFTARLFAWQRVHGLLAVDDDGRRIQITLADVRRRVGLVTNAEPFTAHAFRDRLARELLNGAVERVKAQEVSDNDVQGDSARRRNDREGDAVGSADRRLSAV